MRNPINSCQSLYHVHFNGEMGDLSMKMSYFGRFIMKFKQVSSVRLHCPCWSGGRLRESEVSSRKEVERLTHQVHHLPPPIPELRYLGWEAKQK